MTDQPEQQEDQPAFLYSRQSPSSNKDEAILDLCSQVHQICRDISAVNADDGIDCSCHLLLEQLNQDLSQLVLSFASSTSSSAITEPLFDLILKNTKKCLRFATKLKQLHPILWLAEKPALLEGLLVAVQELDCVWKTLVRDNNSSCNAATVDHLLQQWETHRATLSELKENSVKEKHELIQGDVLENLKSKHLLPTQSTNKDIGEVQTVLEKKKRKLFKESLNETRDLVDRQDAAAEMQYLDQIEKGICKNLKLDDEEASLHIANWNGSSHGMVQDSFLQSSLSFLEESTSATATNTSSSLPDWAICPITKTIMMNPVTVRADCNHTISQQAFQEWLDQGNNTCPLCGIKLKALWAKANPQLQWNIESGMVGNHWNHDHNNKSLHTHVGHLYITATDEASGTNEAPTSTHENIPKPTMVRRFSTGEFVSGRSVSAANAHTNPKGLATIMSLKQEGGLPTTSMAIKPSMQPLITERDMMEGSMSSLATEDIWIHMPSSKERSTKDATGNSCDHSVSTLGVGNSSHPSLSYGDLQDSIASLESFGVVDLQPDKGVTVIQNNAKNPTTDTGTNATERMYNGIHKNKSNKVSNIPKQQRQQHQGQYNHNHNHSKSSSSGMDYSAVSISSANSKVRFAHNPVTGYINPLASAVEDSREFNVQNASVTTTTIISKDDKTVMTTSYPMMDRNRPIPKSNQKPKNSIQKFFQKLGGRHTTGGNNTNHEMSAKIIVQLNNSYSTHTTTTSNQASEEISNSIQVSAVK